MQYFEVLQNYGLRLVFVWWAFYLQSAQVISINWTLRHRYFRFISSSHCSPRKKRGTRKKGGLWSVWLLIAYLNSIWFSGHTHRVSTTSLVLPAWFHVFRNGLSGSEVYHSSFRFLSVFRTLSQNCTFIPFELRRLRTLHINWHGMSPI